MRTPSRLLTLAVLLSTMTACSKFVPVQGPTPPGENGPFRYTMLDGNQVRLWNVAVLGDSAVSGRTSNAPTGVERVLPVDSIAMVEESEFSVGLTVLGIGITVAGIFVLAVVLACADDDLSC